MPFRAYISKSFTRRSLERIDQANSIIDEYAAQGYALTLRQLYYQFVARDLLPNTQQSYSNLGGLINDARMAGMIDWLAIEDRTRQLKKLAHWDDAEDILSGCADQFRVDKWADQPCRVEVWIEKEALAGIFARVANKLDIPYFSCRGYASASSVWRASQRFIQHENNDQKCVILHFGDHDPSGIDMTRDIEDRLQTFGCNVDVRRLALNRDQIDQYNPPPNPAKLSDSRAAAYVELYGRKSWELDALEPQVLVDLVRDAVAELRDDDLYDAREDEENLTKENLRKAAANWGALEGTISAYADPAADDEED